MMAGIVSAQRINAGGGCGMASSWSATTGTSQFPGTSANGIGATNYPALAVTLLVK